MSGALTFMPFGQVGDRASESLRLLEAIVKRNIAFIGHPATKYLAPLSLRSTATLRSGTGFKGIVFSDRGYVVVADDVYGKSCVTNVGGGLSVREYHCREF